jgi:hypothetical protein
MNNQTEQQTLFFNGINGDSGQYDLPPMSSEELSQFILRQSPAENLADLMKRYRDTLKKTAGLVDGLDATNLQEAGWGIIFAHDADPAIEEALGELLALRQQQAGNFFRTFKKGDGFRRPNDTKSDFLARHGMAAGPAVPSIVPYYLLIVGSPEEIPYIFQYQLDVQYAVGRIHFETLDEYQNYARSVVQAESGAVKLSREVAYFSVANSDDPSTQLSATELVQPLHEKLAGDVESWQHTAITPENATKARLTQLLGGDQTPALLFTASHGMSFDPHSPNQRGHQGALLCQDWPGPRAWRDNGPISPNHYFSAVDLSDDANLLGQIAFFFACFSAGTPQNDDFSKQAFKERKAIAPNPFLARLPQKMLGHPRGGALATIGHVDRTWGYSFSWPGAGRQTAVFESTFKRLLRGHPVGSALEYFNLKYAELATVLNTELEEIDMGEPVDPFKLAGLWTANNDARGYAIIGDPAVRLSVVKSDKEPEQRPQIEVQPPANKPVAAATSKPAPASAADQPTTPGAIIPAAIDDVDLNTVTIETYTAVDMDNPQEKQLRIQTHITLNGKVETIYASSPAEEDPQLISLHQAIVKEAVTARLAYLDFIKSADE